eukprot:s4767_g1.t3
MWPLLGVTLSAAAKQGRIRGPAAYRRVRGTVSFEQKNGSHAAGSSADEFRKSEGKSYVSKIATAQGSNPPRRHNTSWGEHTKTGCSFRAATVSDHYMFELSLVKEKLQVAANAAEEEILQAWKKLVLLLHPEKLQRLDDESKKEGADALHEVHEAKDEMRRYLRSQRLELLLAALMQHPGRESMKSAGRCLMPR